MENAKEVNSQENPLEISEMMQAEEEKLQRKLEQAKQRRVRNAVEKIFDIFIEEKLIASDWPLVAQIINQVQEQRVGSLSMKDLHDKQSISREVGQGSGGESEESGTEVRAGEKTDGKRKGRSSRR